MPIQPFTAMVGPKMCLVGALTGRVTTAGAGEGHSNLGGSQGAGSFSACIFSLNCHDLSVSITEKSSLCLATQLVNSRANMGISHQNTAGAEKYLHNTFHLLLTSKQIRQVELKIIQAYCM